MEYRLGPRLALNAERYHLLHVMYSFIVFIFAGTMREEPRARSSFAKGKSGLSLCLERERGRARELELFAQRVLLRAPQPAGQQRVRACNAFRPFARQSYYLTFLLFSSGDRHTLYRSSFVIFVFSIFLLRPKWRFSCGHFFPRHSIFKRRAWFQFAQRAAHCAQ